MLEKQNKFISAIWLQFVGYLILYPGVKLVCFGNRYKLLACINFQKIHFIEKNFFSHFNSISNFTTESQTSKKMSKNLQMYILNYTFSSKPDFPLKKRLFHQKILSTGTFLF